MPPTHPKSSVSNGDQLPSGAFQTRSMKRLMIPVLMAVAAIFGISFLNPRKPARRPAGLAFGGFTNTSERNEALFWFTNRAEPDFAWHVLKMSRKDSNGWADEPPWTNGGPSIYTPRSSSGLPLRGYEDLDLVGLPLWTTNMPVRVVLLYFERENTLRRFEIWLREKKDSFRTGTKVVYSRQRPVEVTGQTEVP